MTTGKKDVDFGINFEKERELLLRYVKKETPNIDLAEDIVQETLLKLAEYQKKEIIKSPQAFFEKNSKR